MEGGIISNYKSVIYTAVKSGITKKGLFSQLAALARALLTTSLIASSNLILGTYVYKLSKPLHYFYLFIQFCQYAYNQCFSCEGLGISVMQSLLGEVLYFIRPPSLYN